MHSHEMQMGGFFGIGISGRACACAFNESSPSWFINESRIRLVNRLSTLVVTRYLCFTFAIKSPIGFGSDYSSLIVTLLSTLGVVIIICVRASSKEIILQDDRRYWRLHGDNCNRLLTAKIFTLASHDVPRQ